MRNFEKVCERCEKVKEWKYPNINLKKMQTKGTEDHEPERSENPRSQGQSTQVLALLDNRPQPVVVEVAIRPTEARVPLANTQGAQIRHVPTVIRVLPL